MSQREVLELKKELEFRRRQIVKLEQELRDKDQTIVELRTELRKFEEENRTAHQTLLNLDKIVAERADKAAQIEQDKFRKLVTDLQQKNDDLRTEINRLIGEKRRLDDKDAEIEFLNKKLSELAASGADRDTLRNLRVQKDDHLDLRREVERLTKNWTTLSNQMEDILSENRVLREMAGVPENYGFNLNEIKLVERQKIEEYRGRIKRLEEEVEELEKERVDLRYRLRNMSTLYGEKGLRFYNLTAEQMELVDKFAQNLRDGKIEVPLNDRSRELLKEVERLKAQIQILEAHAYSGVPVVVPTADNGLYDQILEQIRQENKEIKELLIKLYTGSATPQDQAVIYKHILQLPPAPIANPQGEYKEGYSYRYSSKMPVTEIWTGDTKRDIAALQLQLIETLEVLCRRDQDEKITILELEEFRNKLREILLVQELLYEDYGKELNLWKQDRTSLSEQLDNFQQEIRELRTQLIHYEEMARTIQQQNPGTEKAKVAELTTRIALLDVNNLRLSRKYECLQAEENDLRQAYHNIEAEHAEKDVIVQKRIGKLKEWRVSATLQLQFLFKQLRLSVPYDQYEEVCHDLNLHREKLADCLDREAQLYKRLARFENMERENYEMSEKLKESRETRIEIDSELEMLSSRLEAYDPYFKLERAVLLKVVTILKNKHLAPEQAFAIFDRNGDGRISRPEFRAALEKIGIRLMPAEVDALVRSIDTDYDGNIKYSEFIKKLRIYGIEGMREEQQVLYSIYEAIVKLNYSLEDVFKIFDRDGDGLITRQELIDSFHNFGLGLTNAQIDKVLKMIDTNKDGQIRFEEFKRVFDRELSLEPVESKILELDWKDELFNRINTAIKTYNVDLTEAFSALDENKDGRITKGEFIATFNRMGVNLSKAQFDELWNTVDKNKDGSISYAELITQLKTSSRQRETQIIVKEAEDAVALAGTETSYMIEKRQLAVMEAREQAAIKKAERYQNRMKNLEVSLSEVERQLSQLEAKHLDMTRKYHTLREEEGKLKAQVTNSITKSEAEALRQANEKLSKELAEARAAMNTYKNIVGVSADQVRALQLTIERRKDEVATFQAALRELQADSVDAATVGKLFHQVMISRWSEATVNRKYDNILNETRHLRNEVFKLESELNEKEQGLYNVQQVLTEKVADYERRITILKTKSEHNISLERASELVNQIRELGDKKSELEDFNRKLRGELNELKDTKEVVELMKNETEKLYELMKTGSPDELSDRLVEMSERISIIRLNELRAKREASMSKEKEEYLDRVNLHHLENIRLLESEVARWEGMLAKKEEIWRKKDDERQKMLLNPKFLPTNSIQTQPAGATVMPSELAKKEEEISVLREQLRAATETVIIRDKQLEYMTKIRQDAQAVGSSLADWPNAGLSKEELARVLGETEVDQLADAAGATIATLEQMLDNKNKQLERKEETIKELKELILKQQQEIVVEKKRLTDEMYKNERGAMQELQGAINATNALPSRPALYRPDYDALIAEKDNRLAQLSSQLQALQQSKESTETRLSKLRHEIDRLQYELNVERAQNSNSQLKKEIEDLKKRLRAKDKELEAVKASLKALKEDLLEAAEANAKKEKEVEAKVYLDSADNTLTTQQMKKAENRILALTKQLKEARDEISKHKQIIDDKNAEAMRLREEIKKLTDNQYKKQEQIEKLMKDNRDLKQKTIERPQSAAPPVLSNTTGTASARELKQLQDKVAKLESEKKKMKEKPQRLREIPDLDPRADSLLRRVGNILRNKGTTLKILAGIPKINSLNLSRLLEDQHLGLDDEEIQRFVEIASIIAKDRTGDYIDLNELDNILKQILTTPPRPANQDLSPLRSAPDSSNSSYLEEKKKLELKIELLSKQLSQSIQDLETARKELSHWKEVSSRLEKEKQFLENRVDLPEARRTTTITASNIETVEDLRREIYQLQENNSMLERRIETLLQPEIKKLKSDLQRAEDENRRARNEIISLTGQLERFRASRLTGSNARITEEESYVRQLKEDIEAAYRREKELHDNYIDADRQLVELKFEKESYSLQLSRLQRRIRDLEQFKAVVLRDGVRPEPSTTVKFSQAEEMRQEVTIGKSQKERELEQIIESLKKVVARLSSENENLKKNMVSTNRSFDKTSQEKTLKDRIASLEEEVRELRAREEINRDLESKLKRVNKENNDLRGELERELKRVDDNDSKYRALLVQYDVMTKDNERLRRALDELTS